MNDKLGFAWSMSLLGTYASALAITILISGFIGLALSAVPYILVAYGPIIREKSRFSKKVLAARRTR
jgi:hypothetical protein